MLLLYYERTQLSTFFFKTLRMRKCACKISQENEQLVLYFSFFSCKDYKLASKCILMEIVLYILCQQKVLQIAFLSKSFLLIWKNELRCKKRGGIKIRRSLFIK